MILSKLYCNHPDIFKSLNFNKGLNYVIGEVKDSNKKKDTHNLGKTTLLKLIDFCFISGVNKNHFLKKNEVFKDYVFALEIELSTTSFLTIVRTVEISSKASFIKSTISKNWNLDESNIEENASQYMLPFQTAISYLNAELNLTIQKGFSYKDGLSYFMRQATEYADIFKLSSQSKNIEWIPYLMHLLGYDYSIYIDLLKLDEQKKKIKTQIEKLKLEAGKNVDDLRILYKSKLDLKKNLEYKISKLNFSTADIDRIKKISNELDSKIVEVNNELYNSNSYLRQISTSLEYAQKDFNITKTEEIFKEAGLVFPNELKRGFVELNKYNKDLTADRVDTLLTQKEIREEEIGTYTKQLETLNKKREAALKFVNTREIAEKYIDVSKELTKIDNDLEDMFQKIKKSDTILDLAKKQNLIDREVIDKQIELNEMINVGNDTFENIGDDFKNFINTILSKEAYIKVSTTSKSKTPTFKISFVNDNQVDTEESEGYTYNKFLCIAFDLVILKEYKKFNFFSFVFHDGFYENMDDRKKILLRDKVREYENEGIQQIITFIDSDIPKNEKDFYTEAEILLKLNDKDKNGRLFKMGIW